MRELKRVPLALSLLDLFITGLQAQTNSASTLYCWQFINSTSFRRETSRPPSCKRCCCCCCCNTNHLLLKLYLSLYFFLLLKVLRSRLLLCCCGMWQHHKIFRLVLFPLQLYFIVMLVHAGTWAAGGGLSLKVCLGLGELSVNASLPPSGCARWLRSWLVVTNQNKPKPWSHLFHLFFFVLFSFNRRRFTFQTFHSTAEQTNSDCCYLSHLLLTHLYYN
jgi:hypothetical protein